MAATTISAILERFQRVLEAEPLNLVPTGDPFSDVATPNVLVGRTYRLVSGGVVRDTPQSNFSVARLQGVQVFVQQPMNFDGYQAQEDLQDLLDEVERAVIADGPDHSYFVMVEKGSRKITRKKDSDVCEGAITFLCDFDFSEQ